MSQKHRNVKAMNDTKCSDLPLGATLFIDMVKYGHHGVTNGSIGIPRLPHLLEI
jgi:hypothetical protein